MPPLGLFFAAGAAALPIDGLRRSGYLHPPNDEAAVSQSDEQRIAREEQEWTAPKLFGLGFVFLGICIAVIYAMASV